MTMLSRKAKMFLRQKLPKGKVKRKEYLNYLVSVRCAEFNLRDHGVRVVHKSIVEIRAEYESKYGSIYVEM